MLNFKLKTMKRIILVFSIFIMSVFGCMAFAEEHPIPVTSLPAQVQTFVSTHFKGNSIIYAEKDNYSKTKYEVRLNDGTEISFDRKCNWDKVDTNSPVKTVPDEFVPTFIKNYVKNNMKNQLIIKIDKERYGYEIELSSGIELKFDKKGNVIDFDD